jgi:predicted PurR-regulated permease PerM
MPVPELLERSAAAVRRARIDITSRGDLPDATSLAERLKELEGQFLLELRPGNADPAAQFPISEECKLSAQARLAAWSDAIRELQQWGQATGQQQQIRESDLQRYREIALRIDTHYRRLRQEILGGAFRSWATELANPSPQDLRGWQERTSTYLRNYLVAVTGQTTAWVGRLLFGLSIMIIAMFYFFVDGPSMVKSLMRLSPLDDRHEQKLLQEFSNVSRAVVLATLLSALIQGILAGIGYFFAGVHPLIFLTILTTITALIPFVGAAAVWVPAAVWLAFVENRQGAGIGLAVYGFLVVSMADNLIKPLVLHGQSNIHPLVGLLSVLGGVQALGPIGILVGPMLVAFMQALLVMLRQELEQ